MTSFKIFADLCERLKRISSSLEMTSVVASFLKEVDNSELEIATRFIMGNVFPVWTEKELGIGTGLLYAAIAKTSSLPVKRIEELVKETGDVGKTAEKAIANRKGHFDLFSEEELSIQDVFSRFLKIADLSGKGSQDAKIKNLQYLFGASKPVEIKYVARLAVEELRIGVGEGIVRNAISEAYDVPSELVERGYMLVNDYGLVAYTAKKEGVAGLLKLSVKTGIPIKLMLAQVAEGINEAVAEMDTVAVEWKFDGARVQIHKDGNKVTIYSRRLENVTSSLPDIVRSVRNSVKADIAILDGECVALGTDNRTLPFQEILKRFRRKYDVTVTAIEIPLSLNLFDLLYINGESLIETELIDRRKKLEEICDNSIVARQTITDNVAQIEDIYKEALAAGHEGGMLKNPKSLYTPGKRGKNWLKLKPIMDTLDLVVVGGEWGEGRRTSFFGSYLMACRDPDTNKLLTIGRVATGIKDEKMGGLTR